MSTLTEEGDYKSKL